ncbi:MAG: protein kinase [Sandaracinaceae bacterium]
MTLADSAVRSLRNAPVHTPERFERERVRLALRAKVFGSEPTSLWLGRYRVVDRIAAGGTSIVYRAHDDQLDRQVALKLLTHDAHVTCLTREGRALARLDHPGTVRVYDVGVHEGLAFIVIEIVEGETLAAWLARERRDWRAVLELLLPVGDALVAAHRAGLLHRDVKPANVLLDREGVPRLADFGFSGSLVAGRSEAVSPPGPRLAPDTAASSIAGTPEYMAPEQWGGANCDERTDQFGYCVTLYEALYGRRPVGTNGRAGLPNDGGETPPLGAVPRWLGELLARGLSPDTDARFPSLSALLDAVRNRLESVVATALAQADVARFRREEDSAQRIELGVVAGRSLERALSVWPDNTDARFAHAELQGLMFDDAIEQGEVERASSLLHMLDDADGARERQLASLRAQLEAPARRLARLERDRDTRVEERFKARSIALSAAGWTVAYVVYAVLARAAVIEVTPLALSPFFVVYAALGWLGLRMLPAKYAANRVNHDLTLVACIVTTGHAVATLGCAVLGASTATALLFAHVQAATGYAIAGLAYDRRAAWLTPSNALGAALIAAWPDYALEIAAAIVPIGSALWVISHRGASGTEEGTSAGAGP